MSPRREFTSIAQMWGGLRCLHALDRAACQRRERQRKIKRRCFHGAPRPYGVREIVHLNEPPAQGQTWSRKVFRHWCPASRLKPVPSASALQDVDPPP